VRLGPQEGSFSIASNVRPGVPRVPDRGTAVPKMGVHILGGLQPASVGCNPVHVTVYKVEPQIHSVLTA
jgi:hypothetical protein